MSILITTFSFPLAGLFLHKSLQVRQGPHRYSTKGPLGIAGGRFFTGQMPFLSLNPYNVKALKE